MRPREAYAVVVRSTGLLTILFGAYRLVETVAGNVVASMFMSDVGNTASFSLLQDATVTLKSKFTVPALTAGLTLGALAVVVGFLLIRYSSCLADFSSSPDSDSFTEIR